jgi:transitional endoplasmic reticulum ATPase
MKEISAKVKDALRQQEVGRGVVRISENILNKLSISPGDAVLIKGKKETIALVWGELDEDDSIRMDGTLRYNAGVTIDEEVKIKSVKLENTKTLSLSPLQNIDFNPDFIEYVHEKIINMPLIQGNSIIINVVGRKIQLVVNKVNPSPSRIVWETKIQISKKPIKGTVDKAKAIRYEDIGGLKSEIESIREMVEIPIKNPEIFRRLGVEPPKGVLLYGPPGTGKTLLAKAVANETDAHFITLNGPEIMSKFYGQSEENLRKVFKEAQENAPTIIFIDELDAIAPNRNEVSGEVERRVVSQLLTLMDGLEARGDIIIMASTNRPDSIDPALRRPGRFDREIVIGMPNREARKEILQIHTRSMPIDLKYKKNDVLDILNRNIKELSKKIKTDDLENKLKENIKQLRSLIKTIEESKNNDVLNICEKSKLFNQIKMWVREASLDPLAEKTIGYTGADVESLAKEAAMYSLKEIMPDLKKQNGKLSKDTLDKMKIKKEHFDAALRRVEPSAMREVSIEVPNITWDDVGGLNNAKNIIRESVEWPAKYPKFFESAGITPPQGILLYGPPGTGKTLLAKAVAHEVNANFIVIKGPELLSKWVGESEKGIRKIFSKARQVAPAIIFFDEIDALVPARGRSSDSGTSDKLTAQLLTEMDGVSKFNDVLVMASTNRPDLLDKALLRPGRFDKLIYIGIPDLKARKEIFKVHTKNMQLEKGFKIDDFAKKTENYSGADIFAVCREAGLNAIRESVKKKKFTGVTTKHFEESLKKIKPLDAKEGEETNQSIVR